MADLFDGTLLGLDTGTTSIGWWLWSAPDTSGCRQVLGCGVRLFPDGLEAKTGTPLNANRREKRSIRTTTRRTVERRQALQTALVLLGLWPTCAEKRTALFALNPYELRCKALDEHLTPYELGAALLHLSQRRGFLSTRKAGKPDKEDGDVAVELTAFHEEMRNAGSRTYGEHFFNHVEARQRIRGRKLDRLMVIAEFDQIWEAQQAYHPVLTESARWGTTGRQDFPTEPIPADPEMSELEQFGVEGVAFFQRSTYWDIETVGDCELERQHGNIAPRCPRAHREFERFRLYNDLNNLRFREPAVDLTTGEIVSDGRLTEGMRSTLFDALTKQKAMKLSKARKLLGQEDNTFTIERDKKSPNLIGLQTDQVLSKLSGGLYDDLNDKQKSAVNGIVLDDSISEREASRQLERFFPDGEVRASVLTAPAHLAGGRSTRSLAAIRKLMPHVAAGLPEQARDGTQCAVVAAGYTLTWNVVTEPVDRLGPSPDLPNPVARRAMSELRKVINAIVDEYGKPGTISIELAREIKQSKAQREKYDELNTERQKVRNAAAKEILEAGYEPKPRAILRVRLWHEQNKLCIGCDTVLNGTTVYDGHAEVDHILPRWLSLDDSQSNKVLLCAACNSAKGRRTFCEWLGEDSDEFHAVIERSAGLPYPKRQRIKRVEPVELDECVARQLQDTRYIATEARRYLASLYGKLNRVQVCSGSTTASLRYAWGLNSILHDGENKTRDDHRHHAIDAAVVGLTNPATVKQTALARQRNQDSDTTPPWETVRSDIRGAVETIVPSHKRQTRPLGALHEETVYGATQQRSNPIGVEQRPWAREWIETGGVVTVRKKLRDMKAADLKHVRDRALREDLLAVSEEEGISGSKTLPAEYQRPSGQIVRSVRIVRKLEQSRPRSRATRGLVEPGNNHRINYFMLPKGKWAYTVDTVWSVVAGEAMAMPDDDGATYLFSLRKGDTVLIDQNSPRVVRRIEGGVGRIQLQECNAAGEIDRTNQNRVSLGPAQTRNLRRARVDILGRITELST